MSPIDHIKSIGSFYDGARLPDTGDFRKLRGWMAAGTSRNTPLISHRTGACKLSFKIVQARLHNFGMPSQMDASGIWSAYTSYHITNLCLLYSLFSRGYPSEGPHYSATRQVQAYDTVSILPEISHQGFWTLPLEHPSGHVDASYYDNYRNYSNY